MGSPLLDGFRNQASSFIKDKIKIEADYCHSGSIVDRRSHRWESSWPPADTRTKGMISRAAFDVDNYWSIVQVLHKRLGRLDRRNWRVSYKALILLEHLVTHGPKSVADEFDDVDVVKETRNFQFVDEKGFNWGLRVQLSERVLKLLEKYPRPYLEHERARARVLMRGIQRHGGSFDRGLASKVDAACLGSSLTLMFGRCNSEYNTRNHNEESEDERCTIDDHHLFIEISHDRSAAGHLSGSSSGVLLKETVNVEDFYR